MPVSWASASGDLHPAGPPAPAAGTCPRLAIGAVVPASPVVLAPMTGVSDLPFRRLAQRLGAGLVVSEMVASRELAAGRQDVLRRARGEGLAPHMLQLVGSEPHWMAEGARLAEAAGADIVDINMGCPAREVTGRLSGSALMRDPDEALRLIEAVVGAVTVPVTLKMRLGWDDRTFNAPAIAARAEAAGVRLITVHGRTRCQFFRGAADWRKVAEVKAAVRVPVVVNGDITHPDEARVALALSGADAVMVGRGAYGQPWQCGRIAGALATGRDPGPPTPAEQCAIAVEHVEAMLVLYGAHVGLRNARKHLGWYVATSGIGEAESKLWRRRLCTEESPRRVLADLTLLYAAAGSSTTARRLASEAAA